MPGIEPPFGESIIREERKRKRKRRGEERKRRGEERKRRGEERKRERGETANNHTTQQTTQHTIQTTIQTLPNTQLVPSNPPPPHARLPSSHQSLSPPYHVEVP
jgi:hypothetical protein